MVTRNPAFAKQEDRLALHIQVSRTIALILRCPIPDELIAAVVSGGRVFVINAGARMRVKPILACDATWKESQRKAAEAQDAYITLQLEDKARR
jgi:hypothetical protein